MLTFFKYEWLMMTRVLPLIAGRKINEDVKKLLLAKRSKVLILYPFSRICPGMSRTR